MREQTVVIAAGGTGGHFFPAEALAAELSARGHRIVLMTDERAASRLPDSFRQHEVHVLKGAGVAGRGLKRQVSALAGLAMGAVQARAALTRLSPSVVVGFGGYPVIAPVLGSRLLRHRPPVILHDQNAVLGTANRAMARFASALALSFPVVSRVPPGAATVVTGNPVRPAFGGQRALQDGRVHLLVLGGSLGARVFSDVVPPALLGLPARVRERLSVVQQCRTEDLERVRQMYAEAGIAAELSRFFNDVPARMLRADLFIGRAGGSTVAELAASGLAGILVPLPIAVDDDQGHNARALADFGAAWVMRQPDFTSGALAERLGVLLADPSALRDAGKAAGGLTRPDAAARLADLVELQMTSRFAEKKNFSTEKTESHGEPRRRAVQRLTLSADNRHFLHVMAEPCPWACPEDLPTTHDLFSVNGLKSWMAGTGSAMTWLTRRCRSANQAAPQGTAA